MSIKSGRLICPKCKNINMILVGNNNKFERMLNRYKCIKDNGITLWNFFFLF